MDKILHQLVCSLSPSLQGFIHPRWFLWDFWTINRISHISPKWRSGKIIELILFFSTLKLDTLLPRRIWNRVVPPVCSTWNPMKYKVFFSVSTRVSHGCFGEETPHEMENTNTQKEWVSTCISFQTMAILGTEWAPTSYKWSYNPISKALTNVCHPPYNWFL